MSQWTVEVTEQAEYDLADAAAWYEKQGTGLGVDLVARTRETIERIGKAPLIYPLLHNDLRRAGVKRFSLWRILSDGKVGRSSGWNLP